MSEGTQILAKSDVPPLTLMHAVGKQVSAVNPEQQIYNNVEDLSVWISEEPEWQQDHLVSWIFGLFGCWASPSLPWDSTASCRTPWPSEQTNLEFAWRWVRGVVMSCG